MARRRRIFQSKFPLKKFFGTADIFQEEVADPKGAAKPLAIRLLTKGL